MFLGKTNNNNNKGTKRILLLPQEENLMIYAEQLQVTVPKETGLYILLFILILSMEGKTIEKWVDLFGSLNSEIESGIFPT